jgi:hypothetical protein
MNYLHSAVQIEAGQAVLVELDHAANVKVMDESNFARYRRGEAHQYFGGQATRRLTAIQPPRPGRWHLTIDLGGYRGTVRANIRVQ